MPASDSAGDLLLVALKMPPSRIGTYSNFTPVRFSIAGIASWLRNALGLPKSNMNCGALKAILPPIRLRILYDLYHLIAPYRFTSARSTANAVRAWLERRRREQARVIADIGRPVVGPCLEAFGVAREQRARDLLEMWLVLAHRGDEPIGSFLRMPDAVLVLAGAPRLIDQLAQRDRCAAGLPRQPFPVARKQRELARDHAQVRPPRSAGRCANGLGSRKRHFSRLRQPPQDVLDGAAEIK